MRFPVAVARTLRLVLRSCGPLLENVQVTSDRVVGILPDPFEGHSGTGIGVDAVALASCGLLLSCLVDVLKPRDAAFRLKASGDVHHADVRARDLLHTFLC